MATEFETKTIVGLKVRPGFATENYRCLNFTTGPDLSRKWTPNGTTVANFRDQKQFRSPIKIGLGDQVCVGL